VKNKEKGNEKGRRRVEMKFETNQKGLHQKKTKTSN
jgi:hypothetical protein